MSPCLKKSGIPHISFPRVSGDEPKRLQVESSDE